MSQDQVKGKTASLIGVIIAVLSLPLAAAVFYIAYVNNFERVWVLVASGLALFCAIGLFVSFKGSSKMKRSGGKTALGKIGMLISTLSLLAALGVIGKGAMTEQKENAVYDDKAFDKDKQGMDSLLNMLNGGGDSTHSNKDSAK